MLTTRTWSNAIAVLAAVLLLVATACNGGGGGNGDTGGDQDTGTQDTAMQDTGAPEDTATPEDTGGTADTGGDQDTGGPSDTGGNPDTGTPGDVTAPDGGSCTFFPDNCPDGKNCFIGQNGRICAPIDSSKSEGDSCSEPNGCADGQLCRQGKCRNKCDPDNTQQYGCSSDYTCIGLQTQGGMMLPYGVCQPACTVWPDDSCGDGKNCYPTPNGNTCASYGSKSKGDSCQRPTECGKDLYCANGTCVAKCNGENPCDSGSCQTNTNLPFGVCISQ